jgi:hypothetical protein
MTTQKQIDDGGSVTADLISERYVAGIGTIQEKVKSVGGLSLRDYFAEGAMRGIVSSCPRVGAGYAEAIARDSFTLADAMLAARKGGA